MTALDAAGGGARRRPVPGAGRRYAGLGTARLFLAFAIVLGLKMLFDLAEAAAALGGDHPIGDRGALRIAMWAILIVSDVAIAVVTRVLGDHLPSWLYWMFVGVLGIVTLMDLVAVWGSPDPGRALTAGTSAGMSLILAVPTRSAPEIAAAITGIGALLVVGLTLAVNTAPGTAAAPADAVFALCQVCGAVIAATLIAVQLRRLVRHELASATRSTGGGERSDRLVRLDLAAESLLEAVADGRAPLPLAPEIAQRAARLATELRRHLLESRSRTWLDLAVAESELLHATITVGDPAAAAGLLGTRQRGALLSALWLLTERRRRPRRPASDAASTLATVQIAPPLPDADGHAALRITITVPWSSRSRVDPGVWEHLAQVGRYYEANAGRGLAVEIDALVAAPSAGSGAVSGGVSGGVSLPHGTNGPASA